MTPHQPLNACSCYSGLMPKNPATIPDANISKLKNVNKILVTTNLSSRLRGWTITEARTTTMTNRASRHCYGYNFDRQGHRAAFTLSRIQCVTLSFPVQFKRNALYSNRTAYESQEPFFTAAGFKLSYWCFKQAKVTSTFLPTSRS